MTKDQKSLGAGLAFILLGGVLLFYAHAALDMGTARRMGPGYFPRMVALGLVLIGAMVIATAKGITHVDLRHWPLRQMAMVSVAVLVFAVGLDRIGFLASAFAMTLIATKARRETKLHHAALIAAAITVFCAVVFRFGLGIPFRLY